MNRCPLCDEKTRLKSLCGPCLKELHPERYQPRPKLSGVYAIQNGRTIYIGESEDVRARHRWHKQFGRTNEPVMLSSIEGSTKDQRLDWEREWHKHFAQFMDLESTPTRKK